MLGFLPATSRRAFTIVEILVVVAIIGILTAVVYANFSQARAVARDNMRKNDLKNLQLAIELYKETYDRYPEAGCDTETGTWRGPGTHNPSWGNTNDCPDYIVGLVPEFIAKLPTDPINEMVMSVGMLYRTNADGTEYKLLSHKAIEAQFIISPSDQFARCPQDYGTDYCGSTPQNTYAVYSKGAADW
jgi:prepilin-type N-terminal cleavage/methylation domain-containing protein